MTRRPDFLVVGAPKCGTTTLYSYFKQSPHVYVPRKELHYFGADLDFALPTPTREEYEREFEPAGDRISWDVDVWYLYSRTAAREIRAYVPDVRIIISVRNPVDFMYSMHSQAVYSQDETEPSFRAALELEETRRRGRSVPNRAYVRHATFYRDLACFSEQVERYRAVFPPEQLHLMLLDDLAADAEAAWAGVSAFLGIPPVGVTRFRAVNANKGLHVPGLARAEAFLRRVVVPRLGLDRFPEPLKSIGKRTLRRIERLNTYHEPRPPLDPELRASLMAEFEPEICALEEILGRDLGHWRS